MIPGGPQQQDVQRCIQECMECAATCTATGQHCLTEGGRLAHADFLRLLRDCQSICSLAAGFMLRQSEHAGRVCEICAEVCEECVTQCQQRHEDEVVAACADVCHRCMESCHRLSGLALGV